MRLSIRRRAQGAMVAVGVIGFVAGTLAALTFAPVVRDWFADTPDSRAASRGQRPERDRVTALGTIEPAGGLIELAGPPGDRIARINVKPGDLVKVGDELVRLSSYTLREAEIETLRLQSEDARKQSTGIRESGELQIRQAERQIPQLEKSQELEAGLQSQRIDLLREQLTAAQRQLERVQSVGRTIPEAQIEQQSLQVRQLEGELEIALAVRQQQIKMSEQELKNANDRLESARKDLDAKLAAVPSEALLNHRMELARLQRDQQSVIAAKSDGVVLQVFAQQGEATGMGPVLRMANLNEMYVRAEVYEDDVPTVRRWLREGGVRASVTNRALREVIAGDDAALTGHVVPPIGMVVGRNRVMPLDPVADSDLRVVEVRVELSDPGLAADFVGMQVDVTLTPAE